MCTPQLMLRRDYRIPNQKQNPTYHQFIKINTRVNLDDLLGWADNGQGKKVPKALWRTTKLVGKGCRAKADKSKHGFNLYAWQQSTLKQLVHFMKVEEDKLIKTLPPPETSWKVYCQPSIRERRQRDYQARVAYRAQRAAKEKGEIYVAPPTPAPPPPHKEVITPPSPTDITSFPVFGEAPLTLINPPEWNIAATKVCEPPTEKPAPKRLNLPPVKISSLDEEDEWDSDCEEEWERFINEEDLVVFEQ